MFLRSLLVLTLILATLAVLPAVAATTIIIRSGTNNGDYVEGSNYASWTQTGTFSGVTIQANLFSSGGTATGNAYLTTQVGAGTTSTSQIGATVPISITNTTAAPFTLFSGLTLGPGTYYVTLQGLDSLAWEAFVPDTTTIVGPGVTANSDGAAFPIAAYPPASTFFSKGQEYIFSAIASASGGGPTGVPVLSGWFMLGAALLLLTSGLWLMKRYRPQE